MKKSRRSSSGTNLPAVHAQHGGRHRFGTEMVEVEAVYQVPAVHVTGPGAWSREADKIAWRDPETGFGCIIRRERPGGHLGGYVGIGPDHPLHGYSFSAIPFDIEVHGGLFYSAACDGSGPPEISICHVDHDQPQGGDVWWFGFACNQITDLVPAQLADPVAASALVHGVQRVYRDEEYVFGQVTDLARQLAAIGDGREMPQRVSPAPPPIGLDPDRAKVRR